MPSNISILYTVCNIGAVPEPAASSYSDKIVFLRFGLSSRCHPTINKITSQFDMKDTSNSSKVTGNGTVDQNPADGTAPEALDKIRSILFGEEVRKTEERFNQIVNLFEQQVESLNEKLSTRVQQLDEKLDAAYSAVGENLNKEREERESRLTNLQSAIAEMDARIANQFSSADARLSEISESANHDISNLSTELKSEINDQITLLKQFVDDAVSRLSSDKADREKMATWFAELSDRLRSD